jgi:hypothetical protein
MHEVILSGGRLAEQITVLEALQLDITSCPCSQVVCTDATLAAVTAARQAGRSLWRVSSTVFGHIASDQVCMYGFVDYWVYTIN